MADINDELDALFDDEEAEQEEVVEEAAAEEEAEAAEAAEAAKAAPKAKVKAKIGSKVPVKKSKTTGSRTGSIPIGKKAVQGGARTRPTAAKPGKAAPKPEPEPEPEATAPARSARTKVAPAPSGGGKGLLAVSLVLNVILLVAVMVTMLKVGGLATDIKALKGDMKTELTSVKNAVTTASNVSRVKFGMVTDPTLGRQAVMVLVPKDATKAKTQSEAWPIDLSRLIRNGEPKE